MLLNGDREGQNEEMNEWEIAQKCGNDHRFVVAVFSLSSNLYTNVLKWMDWWVCDEIATRWCCNWKLVLATKKRWAIYTTHTSSSAQCVCTEIGEIWKIERIFPDQWSRATCFMLRHILCIYSDLCAAHTHMCTRISVSLYLCISVCAF